MYGVGKTIYKTAIIEYNKIINQIIPEDTI